MNSEIWRPISAFVVAVVGILYFVGVFSCNNNGEDVVETEEEIIYTHKGPTQITVYYTHGRRIASYRHFLIEPFAWRKSSARLFVGAHRDGNKRIESLEVWLDHDNRVSYIYVAGRHHKCLEENPKGKLVPVKRNIERCMDAEKVLVIWRIKLDPETRIKRAMKTPDKRN